MSEVRENDLPVEPAPREPAGALVEELEQHEATTEGIEPPPPVLHENTLELEPAPREDQSGAVLVEDVPAPSSVPAAAAPPPTAELPTRRMVGLPARPRLRVSYWFEGDALKCEAVLMDERRALVHRMALPSGPSTDGVFSFFAQTLARDLAQTHTVIIPASPPPAPPSSPPPEPDADPAPTTAREGVETPKPAEVESEQP